MYSDVAVIIPSRIGSTRLHRKPLVRIGDKCLIEHVVLRLASVFKDNLYVATDSSEIKDILENYDVSVIMTEKDCPTGSDRVFNAFQKLENMANINYIINVQGDMPFINPDVVKQIVEKLKNTDCDIVTPVVKVGKDIAENESNVKVVTDNDSRALYFSRSLIPHGGDEFLYHVGIYGFKALALENFIKFSPSKYEVCEKLEQLRALENKMNIGVCFSNEIPLSVDTEVDLKRAINYYEINFIE